MGSVVLYLKKDVRFCCLFASMAFLTYIGITVFWALFLCVVIESLNSLVYLFYPTLWLLELANLNEHFNDGSMLMLLGAIYIMWPVMAIIAMPITWYYLNTTRTITRKFYKFSTIFFLVPFSLLGLIVVIAGLLVTFLA